MNKILNPLWTWGPVLCVMALTSCAPIWESSVRQTRRETTELTGHAYQFDSQLPTSQADQTPDDIPPSIKTLDQLVVWGLKRSPRIAARMMHIRAQEKTISQVSSLPEPTFKAIPFGDMAQTAAGEASYSLGIEQKFPAPGSLGAKARQAGANTKVAVAQFDAEKIDVAYKIRSEWHNYQWAQASHAITNEHILLLEQLKSVILARVEAQTATQSDAVRIGVVIDELSTKRRSWFERRNNAKESLLSALNLQPNTTLREFENINEFQEINAIQLEAIARGFRPDFVVNDAEIESAIAKGLLARSKRRPSFGTFFNYTAIDDNGLSPVANGDDQWQVGFSVTLPIWSSVYAEAEAEAIYLQDKARYEKEAIIDDIHKDTSNAWETLISTHEQLDIVQVNLLAGARRALQLETASYESGQGAYQDLIQSWRGLFAAQLQEAYLIKAYSLATADMLRALGLINYSQISTYLKQQVLEKGR